MLLQNTRCLYYISDKGSWYSVTTHHTWQATLNAIPYMKDIQGDPGGKFNNLGNDIISFYQKKIVHKNTCLIVSSYWDRAVWIYKYISIVNGNKERKSTYYG